jgi:hypothetical protein
MFCKIKKNKGGYTIYLCERKRVDGKVISKDIKLTSYGWHSLYEIDEEYNGLTEDIPMILARSISRIIKPYDIALIDVVEKLEEVKKKYYPTYKKIAIRVGLEFEKKHEERRNKQVVEYEKFKEKFRTLHYNEVMQRYKEGYEKGLIEGILKTEKIGSNLGNRCSVKNTDIGEGEKKLLKEAFKLLSHKHHPDKGGSTEKMAMINNLKEKIL